MASSGKKRHVELLDARKLELEEIAIANNRLMQYTFRLRKLDENLNVLDSSISKLKDHHRKAVRAQKQQHTTTAQELQKQNAAARARHAQLLPQIARVTKQLEAEAGEEQRIQRITEILKNNNAQAAGDFRTSASELLAAEQTEQKIQHEISCYEVGNDSLQLQLDECKAQLVRANEQARAADAHGRQCERELAEVKQTRRKEIADLRQQLDDIIRKRNVLEDGLRKEYKTKLDALVGELQESEDSRKNREVSDLKQKFDQDFEKHCDNLENANRKNDELREELQHATLETNNLEARVRADESTLTAQNRLADALQEELDAMIAQHKDATAGEDAEIRQLEDQIEKKDSDYAELLAVKDALAMEIKAYRLLLENEEDRLGKPDTQSNKKARVEADEEPLPLTSRRRSARLSTSQGR